MLDSAICQWIKKRRVCRLPFAAAMLCGLLLTGCSQGTAPRIAAGEVTISEVMSRNSYYAPLPDGSCCDWVEFHNSSDQPVNLKGCALSDSARVINKWKIPTDCIVEPDGYVVVYLSGQDKVDEEGNLHANFKLSSKGETLIFSNAAGDVLQQLAIPDCDTANVSYGEAAEDGGYVWYAEPSPKRANSGECAESPDGLRFPECPLRLNEYMTRNTCVLPDGNGQYSDWVEIVNTSDEEFSLRGCALSDGRGGDGRWFFPDGASIAAHGCLEVFCTESPSETAEVYHADFRLGEGDILTLYSRNGVETDAAEVTRCNPDVSCGRDPESGEWRLFASPTPGSPNTSRSYGLDASVTASPCSQLYISEALCVSDKDGTYDRDFIEIHNASPQAISLKGCALAKSEDGEKFVFPAMSLEAGGYAVVYCTGKYSAKNGTLTAPFKLNQAGESLILYDAAGRILDRMTTGRQTYGHSSGRRENSPQTVCVFGQPTPGAANSGKSYAGYAPAPVFSSDGGYVSSGFELSIQTEPDCKVYYTTDGTKPDTSSKLYEKPIRIDRTTVVCAVARRDGCLPSQMKFATFLVEKEHTIPVVSVSSPPDGLFSYSKGILTDAFGGLVPGKPNYASDEKRETTFQYFVDGKSAVTFCGGLKVAGEYSRSAPQKGFAFIMSERYGTNETAFPFFGEYSADCMNAFLLRPSGQDWRRAHLRDEFCSRIVRDSTVRCDYQEAQPVALYLNGEYWGLYYIREKLNEDYLVNKYGYTKGNIDIIKWEGDAQSGSTKQWSALLDFCQNNDLRDKKNYEYVASQVDLESLIDWWVFETYAANNDTGNIRCCRDRADGKWHWMLFDLDNAFFLTTYKTNFIESYCLGPTHGLDGCKNTLIRRLLMNEDFRHQFIVTYLRHTKTTFAPDRLNGILDELIAETEPEMERQTQRWGKPERSSYEYNLYVIRDIIKKKPDMAKTQLQEAFHLSSKEMKKLEAEADKNIKKQ